MSNYSYPLSSFVGLTATYPELTTLTSEVAASTIASTLDSIEVETGTYTFVFLVALTAAEQTTLNGLVAAHTGASLPADDISRDKTPQAVAPTVTDDSSKGFTVGDPWYTTGGSEFVCLDATVGAALWKKTTTLESSLGVKLISSSTVSSYGTIASALAAASSGDLVQVGTGTYAESVTVPAQVKMRGLDGAHLTGALSTGSRLTLGDGSEVWGFDITAPSDATPAVSYAGNAGATIHDTTIFGGGASGIGFQNSGLGVLFVDRTRMTAGTIDSLCKSTSGKLQINSLFVAAGTVTSILEASGSSLIEGVGIWAVAPSVVTTGFLVHDAAVSIHGGQVSATNVLHLTSNSSDADIEGGFEFKGSTYDVLVDPGVTTATVELEFCQLLSSKISADAAQLASESWRAVYVDGTFEDTGLRIEAELSVGSVEKPTEAIFGEGDSYVRGMVVFTTDATATSTLDGGNFLDVSSLAASAANSSFSFQGSTANHTILIGSERQNSSGVVKHWGFKAKVITAAVEVTPKSFVHEIWDGSAWVSVGVLATHSSKFYRYANECFIRSNNSEHIRYGVDENTTWSKKTINGKNLYWSRIRITSGLTTAPVFEQFKVHSNRAEINGDGTLTFHGLARFANTLLGVGNIFGESGGVVNFGQAVGSGGLPTGWTHQVKNSQFNGLGDAVYTQFPLPRGIDTSFPLEVSVQWNASISSSPSANMQFIASLLAVEVEGIEEADPTGGIVPIFRSLANTETMTSKPGQSFTVTINDVDSTKIQLMKFPGFDISDYYEGDMVFLRVEMDLDGIQNANANMFSLEISGVRWTLGEHR